MDDGIDEGLFGRPADDQTVRSLAGLVLKAAEQDEVEQLLASIEDAGDRRFVTELAQLASGEYDMHPTSGELLLEEAFEDDLTLTDAHEAALIQGIASARDEGARKVWERALELLARARGSELPPEL